MLLLSRLAAYASTLLLAARTPAPIRQFHFAHDAVLGTSLDLTFTGTDAGDAERAEAAVLGEIERLRLILSGWDRGTELDRLLTTGFLTQPSRELREVLHDYEQWNLRSRGAYTPRIAPLTALWRAGEAAGHLPDSIAIVTTARSIASKAWQVDANGITMLTDQRIDLNSLGKGYVIDHAIAAARLAVPQLRGGIINLGGDIRTWGVAADGRDYWQIGVADPRSPADNAAPLVTLKVTDRAVSSSGHYARGFTIGGVHYSHIIDPRTGQPAGVVAATTVIAADNTTANALATTLCVLSPAEGLALVRTVPGAEALIVDSAGTIFRTAGFAAFEEPSAPPAAKARFKATLTIDITPETPNRHRPYVAVWVTDTAGQHVRTLAFWASKAKYFPEMSKWYGLAQGVPDLVDAVTRATRIAGEYTLEWDGLDEAGKEVKTGPYLFWMEASLEHGPHSSRSVLVACGKKPATGKLDKTEAFAGGTVTCSEAK